MIYKGDSIVLTGTESDRTPFGALTTKYSFEAIPESAAAFVNAQPLGIRVGTRQHDGVVGIELNYPPDVFTDKWETDREKVEKDLLFNPAFTGLTQAEMTNVRTYRASPAGSTNIVIPPGSANTALMNQIQALVLQGTEAYVVFTLVLKRTRTMSVRTAPTVQLTERTQFFSTARLITQEGVDLNQTGALPATPYAPPVDHTWGWLPRNSNRSYISRGFMEEHSDWEFAAWSTVLYQYVA